MKYTYRSWKNQRYYSFKCVETFQRLSIRTPNYLKTLLQEKSHGVSLCYIWRQKIPGMVYTGVLLRFMKMSHGCVATAHQLAVRVLKIQGEGSSGEWWCSKILTCCKNLKLISYGGEGWSDVLKDWKYPRPTTLTTQLPKNFWSEHGNSKIFPRLLISNIQIVIKAAKEIFIFWPVNPRGFK